MGNETPKHVRSWFTKAIRQMWPLAVGSISLRRGRCIRPKCPACTSGKLHTNYALYGRWGNRRFSMYVPEEILREVRKAIRNAGGVGTPRKADGPTRPGGGRAAPLPSGPGLAAGGGGGSGGGFGAANHGRSGRQGSNLSLRERPLLLGGRLPRRRRDGGGKPQPPIPEG